MFVTLLVPEAPETVLPHPRRPPRAYATEPGFVLRTVTRCVMGAPNDPVKGAEPGSLSPSCTWTLRTTESRLSPGAGHGLGLHP